MNVDYSICEPPQVIAEIGCNHKGDISTALEMVRIAATVCKVDIVKFQKRHPRELLTEREYHSPHPNPIHAYGATYGEHREFLELSLEDHKVLKAECDGLGVLYTTSVWDMTSTREIVSLQPAFIKVPSATNTNVAILDYLIHEFDGQIHVSLGMTTREEEARIVNHFARSNASKRLVLYSCTSGYPVAFDEICLLEILRLRESYEADVHSIGFSGHHLGIAADVAAMTLGARWIERHFTLDRTWKGTDHAASLEPQGMAKLVRDVHHVKEALRYKPQEILACEQVQRAKLKTQAT